MHGMLGGANGSSLFAFQPGENSAGAAVAANTNLVPHFPQHQSTQQQGLLPPPHVASATGGIGATNNQPAGSWVCPSCNNVNWPLRTTCNRKGCLQPRPGPPIGSVPLQQEQLRQQQQHQQAPEGSWTCLACNNVNWPLRTVCNNRLCKQPRPPTAL